MNARPPTCRYPFGRLGQVATRLMRRFQLPPNPGSPSAARALLRTALAEAQLEHLTDVTLLLTTELCSNVVRHAGTDMELTLSVDDSVLTVAVTDRGQVPLEIGWIAGSVTAQRRSGGYGLEMVAALASSWGTRHDATGRHVVWFSLGTHGDGAPAPEPVAAPDLVPPPVPGVESASVFDRLRGTDRLRRSWMTYLADTSELLAQSLDVNFTAALVPQIVVPRLGDWCAVHLVNERGKITRATWGHADESALGPLRSWLDGEDRNDQQDSTGALRVRIDEALLGTRPITFAVPVEGVTVPLIARGATLGTLTVGRPQVRSHTPEDVALISDVARRASLALSNAQLNAAHVTVSQAFQQALLPRALPVSDQVEFAAAYLPASAGTDVGGDFYDVLALSRERWLVSCGDVCGKGAPAAARTGLVRDVLRVLVRDGCPLERAVRLLNDAMGEPVGEQRFCTLAAALVAARANQPGLSVELVLAGQDQPLLLRADGSTEFLGEFGTAVGVMADMQLCTTRHPLAPGDTMVIYTDGVTERRRGKEFFGRARLAELAGTLADTSAATIAAALRTAIKDFSPGPPKDDIALLVVQAR